MKATTSYFSLALAGVVLLAMIVSLATSRPDECGVSDCPRPQVARTAGTSPTPTLAPPQNSVFVQIESDRPDIQVSWSDN